MDICASNWNEDDASNITAAPDGAPEGMAPSGVNNVLRAHQGAIKRAYNWSIPRQTTGTSTAYTLSYTVAPGALVDGMTHVVEFHVANGAASTLNVNLLGAIPIHYYSAGAWRVLPPGLLGANEICRVAYHGSSGAYRILGRPDRTGELVPFAGSTPPAGMILAYGQAVNRTQYAGLFAAFGTAYGAGDGSSTFNLPDMRGRVAAGKGDMGGSEAGRLNSVISSLLGAAGGSQTQAFAVSASGSGSGTAFTNGLGTVFANDSVTEVPGQFGGHHVSTAHVHSHSVSGNASVSVSVSVSGATDARSITQPTIIVNYSVCV
jgi:microcystin-dependent protein